MNLENLKKINVDKIKIKSENVEKLYKHIKFEDNYFYKNYSKPIRKILRIEKLKICKKVLNSFLEYQKDKKEIKKFETAINEFCSFYKSYFNNNDFSLNSFCSKATKEADKELYKDALSVVESCQIDLNTVKNTLNDNIEKIIKSQFETYQLDKNNIKAGKL